MYELNINKKYVKQLSVLMLGLGISTSGAYAKDSYVGLASTKSGQPFIYGGTKFGSDKNTDYSIEGAYSDDKQMMNGFKVMSSILTVKS